MLKTDESMWIFTGTEHAQFYRENIIIFLSDGEDAVPHNELEEICKLSHRVIVLCEGEITGEFTEPYNFQTLGKAMTSTRLI